MSLCRTLKLVAGLCLVAGIHSRLDADDSHLIRPFDKRLCRQVHSAIVADDSLPYRAHIVRVDAKAGKVILSGKVATEEQKEKVEEKAVSQAGEANVVDNIHVDPL